MDDPERLRRRLYAPGAGAGDVAAYREVEPAAPVGRRRRPVALVAVALVLGVAVVAAALLLVPRRPTAPDARPLALSAADRAELRTDLEAGGAAGIAAYLVTHPSPPQLRGATGFLTQEVHGVGPAELRVGVAGAAAAGRATVLLVTAASGRATWTALPGDRSRSQDVPPGTLTSTTLRYAAGERPDRLRIDVDAGVRWGAAVVYSD